LEKGIMGMLGGRVALVINPANEYGIS